MCFDIYAWPTKAKFCTLSKLRGKMPNELASIWTYFVHTDLSHRLLALKLWSTGMCPQQRNIDIGSLGIGHVSCSGVPLSLLK